jgi:hypothetical protein
MLLCNVIFWVSSLNFALIQCNLVLTSYKYAEICNKKFCQFKQLCFIMTIDKKLKMWKLNKYVIA